MPTIPTPPGAERGEAVEDPFAWTPERSDELTRRAAAGTSAPALHALAGRRGGHRGARGALPRAGRARREGGRRGPDRLEALVFLESAGRPDALAPGGIEGAAGLTQILAETATNLLGDEGRRRAQRQLHAAAGPGAARGQPAAGGGAEPRAAARRRPLRPRQGAGRHRALPEAGASERFGREDLAFVSYHMGMGNLEGVHQRASAAGAAPTPSSTSTPRRCATRPPTRGSPPSATTPRTTSGSSARRSRSCGMARSDPSRLGRLAALQTADDSARRVLLDGAPQGDLRDAAVRPRGHGAGRARGRAAAARGARRSRSTSAAEVRAISDAPALRVTARDDGGWTFRVSRDYASEAPGARVPVRSRPTAGAQRDRLVALGALHPRHRLARREGARAAARPPRREK